MGSPFNDGGWLVLAIASSRQLLDDGRQIFHAHEEDQGSFELRNCFPVEHFCLILEMGCKDMEASRYIPISHRNSCIGQTSHSRSDAWHHFKVHTSFHQLDSFFSASAKDIGITALEADYPLALTGFFDENFFNFFLSDAGLAWLFTHIYLFAVRL